VPAELGTEIYENIITPTWLEHKHKCMFVHEYMCTHEHMSVFNMNIYVDMNIYVPSLRVYESPPYEKEGGWGKMG